MDGDLELAPGRGAYTGGELLADLGVKVAVSDRAAAIAMGVFI